MDESKTIVVPEDHVIEIEYGRAKMRLFNPGEVIFTVNIRKAKESDRK
jgi:hypothetical protein